LDEPIVLPVLSYIVRPIAGFALRHGVKLQTFIKVLKQCYVWEAQAYLESEGLVSSKSKISAMTGVHRKEVNEFMESKGLDTDESSIMRRLIGQWLTDERFSRNGKPNPLTVKGARSEFSELVLTVSRDLNPYTVLFELQRLGLVSEKEEHLFLTSPEYRPLRSLADGMKLVRTDIDDLLLAVESNLLEASELDNLHLTTSFDNIDPERSKEIKEWFLDKGAQLHQEARAFLSKYDRDIQSAQGGHQTDKSLKRIRAVLGSFSRVHSISSNGGEK
jgi:hypothetical protein